MLREWITQTLTDIAHDLLNEWGERWPQGVHIHVEHPGRIEHGDYATNVAMQLTKALRKPPLPIANEIKSRIEASEFGVRMIEKVVVAPPGFINMYLDWDAWVKQPIEAVRDPKRQKQKIIIEHTSINPNKSAHIGHLRNSCIGDSLARLMKRAGYKVEVHNYIDDLGNQLADTVVGILHTETKQEHARFGDFCWEIYARINREYKDNPALAEKRIKVLHAVESGHSNLAWIGTLVAERIVREHLEEMKQFDIGYDMLVWESSIVHGGFWSAAFDLLRQTPLFIRETEGNLAGCWVLKQPGEHEGPVNNPEPQSDYESEHQSDKVLVRSNGILTYTAKDIAYHLWKFGLLDQDFAYRRFENKLWSTHPEGVKKPFGRAHMVINVIDRRQEYPQTMVKQALEALGYADQAANLRHVSYGVVSLSRDTAVSLGIDTAEGRGSYAMSGRQGIGIKISDFLDQMEKVIEQKRSRKAGLPSRTIAAAAIRYYLLRFNLQTEVIFDLQQATEVSGNTGVYLMYAYARAVSILAKAANERGVRPEIPQTLPALEQEEYALLRQIAYWPEMLDSAAGEMSLNLLCNYAYELATLFNNLYASCPILKAEDEQMKFRIWLTEKYRATLSDVLQVLGLPAPDRM